MTVIAEHLAKRYPEGTWGARDVNFTAESGEITVLLGPNGAGKSTTVGMLSTLLRPTRGRALIEGMSTVEQVWKIREIIALCPQDIRVDFNWSPEEAIRGYLMVRGFKRNEIMEKSEEYLKKLDLWGVRNRPSIHLSGGQRKRIAVAMVLASDAPVIFLDEPSSGLDVEARYVVWKSLREEASRGKTIILTTHDMKEAEILADKVVMIAHGETVAEGTVESMKSGLGHAYKIVVKNASRLPLKEDIDLGDRKIIYASSRTEALEMMEKIEAEWVTLEEISLEDVYLHLIGGLKNGKD